MSSDDYWRYQYFIALAALQRAERMLGLQVSQNQLTLF